MLVCVSVCVCMSVCCMYVCGYPLITSQHFKLQDVKEGKEDSRQWELEKRTTRQRERQKMEEKERQRQRQGDLKKSLSTSQLLSPGCARGPRPHSSPEFHSCWGTSPHSTMAGCRATGGCPLEQVHIYCTPVTHSQVHLLGGSKVIPLSLTVKIN